MGADPHNPHLNPPARVAGDGVERTPPVRQRDPSQISQGAERGGESLALNPVPAEGVPPQPLGESSEVPSLRWPCSLEVSFRDKHLDDHEYSVSEGSVAAGRPEFRVLMKDPEDTLPRVLRYEVQALQLPDAGPHRGQSGRSAQTPPDLFNGERPLIGGGSRSKHSLYFMDQTQGR